MRRGPFTLIRPSRLARILVPCVAAMVVGCSILGSDRPSGPPAYYLTIASQHDLNGNLLSGG